MSTRKKPVKRKPARKKKSRWLSCEKGCPAPSKSSHWLMHVFAAIVHLLFAYAGFHAVWKIFF